MDIHWRGQIDVSAAPDAVFDGLADFRRHIAWASSLEQVTLLAAGNPEGVGARYLAVERSEGTARNGWRRMIPRRRVATSISEVTELAPGRRIAWIARPVPAVGEARISFDFFATVHGGTRIVQTIDEHYPWPAALVLRKVFGLDEPAIVRMFGESLESLRLAIERASASGERKPVVIGAGVRRICPDDGDGPVPA